MPNLVTAAKGALEDCSIRIGGDPNGLRLQVGAWVETCSRVPVPQRMQWIADYRSACS